MGDGSLLTDDPLARFKNERDYVGQSGHFKTTVAAMDWAVAEIERLSANHKDVVAMKRKDAGRLKIALAALQQIYDVCKDNAPESCDARMALHFVRQVACDGFEKATSPFHAGVVGGSKEP